MNLNVVACLSIGALLAFLGSLAAEPISGRGRVIDGDTISVNGQAVRLNGISAPEKSERGGYEATRVLEMLIAEAGFACVVRPHESALVQAARRYMPSSWTRWTRPSGPNGRDGLGHGVCQILDPLRRA
jgi:hypothetical protein